jgi:hypothetical protein
MFGGLILEAKELYLNGKITEGTLVKGTIPLLKSNLFHAYIVDN